MDQSGEFRVTWNRSCPVVSGQINCPASVGIKAITLLGHVSLHSYEDVRLHKWRCTMQCICTCLTLLRKLSIDVLIKEILRTFSDAPPTHYKLKIESFSLLLHNSIEKYESGHSFEVGGYKWRLVLYPNGNKKKNVEKHISLYLAIAETKLFQPDWEVYALFKLFLYDPNKDNYMVLQGKERRFHEMKLDWGFHEFISLDAFNDPYNGYLVDDTCVFGAEVFVHNRQVTGKRERLSLIKDAVFCKHVWKVENFSKLNVGAVQSEAFKAGDQKWLIKLNPKGIGRGLGTHLSVTLSLYEPAFQIYAQFCLRILNQRDDKKHEFFEDKDWFSAPSYGWCFYKFTSLAELAKPESGFLVDDTLIVEAEVTVLGVSNILS